MRMWRLVQHVPDRAARVINLVREMRGGKDYDPTWHERMRGGGPMADMISKRFGRAIAKLDMNHPVEPLRTDLFRVVEDKGGQMRLDV